MKRKFLKILAVSSLLLAGGGVIAMHQMHDNDNVMHAKAATQITESFSFTAENTSSETTFKGSKDTAFTASTALADVTFSGTSIIDNTTKNYTHGVTINGSGTLSFKAKYNWSATISTVVTGTSTSKKTFAIKSSNGEVGNNDTSKKVRNVGDARVFTITNGTAGDVQFSRYASNSIQIAIVEMVITYDAYEYDVSFFDGLGETSTNGTQIGTTQTVMQNTCVVSVPEDPFVSDREFLGWSSDGGTTKVSAATIITTPVTSDINYVACWSEPMQTISFTIYDYEQNVPSTLGTIVKGSTIKDMPEPDIRDGYVLDGYYSDSNYTTKLSDDHIIEENSIIYARWVSNVGVQLGFNGAKVVTGLVQDSVVHGFTATNKDGTGLPTDWVITPAGTMDAFSQSITGGLTGDHAMKFMNGDKVTYTPKAPLVKITGITICASFDTSTAENKQFNIVLIDNNDIRNETTITLVSSKDGKTYAVKNSLDQLNYENIKSIEVTNASKTKAYLNAIQIDGLYNGQVNSYADTKASIRFSTKRLESEFSDAQLAGEELVNVKAYYTIEGLTDNSGTTLYKEKDINLKADKTLVDGKYEFDFVIYNIPFNLVNSKISVYFEISGKKIEKSKVRTESVKSVANIYMNDPVGNGLTEEEQNLLTGFVNA